MKIVVSVAAFSIHEGKLKVFLTSADAWSLPQVFLDPGETLEHAAKRASKQLPVGWDENYSEQLYSFDDIDSPDVLTVGYLVLVPPHEYGEGEESHWFQLGHVTMLSRVQQSLITYGRLRLRWKLEYTNVAYSLLPPEFTFSELQNVYEIIVARKFDKRNFRKKIISLNILSLTKNKKRGVDHRPALKYRFRRKDPVIVEIL